MSGYDDEYYFENIQDYYFKETTKSGKIVEYWRDGYIRVTEKCLVYWTSKEGVEYPHSGFMTDEYQKNLLNYWEKLWGKNSPRYQFWAYWLEHSPRLYKEYLAEQRGLI